MGNFPLVIVALILSALGAVMTIIGPDKVGEITDLISDGLMGSIDMSAIAKAGITLIVIYLVSALANFIQHRPGAGIRKVRRLRARQDHGAS